MSKDQKGFIVYGDIKAVIDELADDQVAQLFRGMVDYFTEGTDPKFTGVLKFVWITVRQQMDRDMEKYVEKCERNRANARKRWSTEDDANAYDRMRTHAMDANTNTNTDTDTKKDTDTDTTTTTKTDTKDRGGGGCSDEFDLWKKLTPEDIDRIYDIYPDSGGFLIEEVVADVKQKRKKIKNAASYILGYAKKAGWDDKADHGQMPWEAS